MSPYEMPKMNVSTPPSIVVFIPFYDTFSGSPVSHLRAPPPLRVINKEKTNNGNLDTTQRNSKKQYKYYAVYHVTQMRAEASE
jgi:hypothetical protein